MQNTKLLLVGDSLIEFFNWQARFPNHIVLNRGRAGETVQGLLSRMPHLSAEDIPPDLVMIMTGTNNLAMDDLFFLPDYKKIIDSFLAAYPAAKIIVTSLLPVKFPWQAEDTASRLNTSLKQLAERKQADVLDLYPLFLNADGNPNSTLFLDDGVHLSDQGYGVWAEAFAKIL
ncbi:MAG: GDSL family lipase [Desulfobulbaceae bacterium]|nr:GDSL family lipase [Desulfobulbaceae bacterium]